MIVDFSRGAVTPQEVSTVVKLSTQIVRTLDADLNARRIALLENNLPAKDVGRLMIEN